MGIQDTYTRTHVYMNIWMLIKIKVSGAATIADQSRINRHPNGVNLGRVLPHSTSFCANNCRNIATLLHITVFRDMA